MREGSEQAGLQWKRTNHISTTWPRHNSPGSCKANIPLQLACFSGEAASPDLGPTAGRSALVNKQEHEWERDQEKRGNVGRHDEFCWQNGSWGGEPPHLSTSCFGVHSVCLKCCPHTWQSCPVQSRHCHSTEQHRISITSPPAKQLAVCFSPPSSAAKNRLKCLAGANASTVCPEKQILWDHLVLLSAPSSSRTPSQCTSVIAAWAGGAESCNIPATPFTPSEPCKTCMICTHHALLAKHKANSCASQGLPR